MNKLQRLKDFTALKISLASPEDILNWSYGEITKPETINYRTFKPEKDGLFDERIFGPTKDYECYCGKYKRIRYKGVICDKCGVEVTTTRVRRERMGHISLAAPVVHVWFFRGIPSKLATFLDVSPRNLEAVIYFSSYIVTDFDKDKKKQIIFKIDRDIESKRQQILNEAEKKIKELEKEIKKNISALKISDKTQREMAIKELGLKGRQKIAQLRDRVVVDQDESEKDLLIVKQKLLEVKENTVLTDGEYLDLYEYMDEFSTVKTGADAIREIIKNMDITEEIKKIQTKIQRSKGQMHLKLAKRLKVMEGFRLAKINPAWIVLTVLPVIPPDLRPMVQLEGGRFATSDLNDLYRRVINRNNRLKRLLDLGAPEIIIRNEKRMLQESVDALIDSSKQRSTSRVLKSRKPLRSIADMLKGKQGRFRQNLLGKRVDYSGRSVIVSGPELKFYECGLPREMALELFKPFVLRELLLRGLAPNVKSAKYVLDEKSGVIWDILEGLIEGRPVLLNRAPTLHRLGIQAFYIKLIEGNSIQLHPSVCSGYNADFDGDQMAVHLPLSQNAVSEAVELMLSPNNLLKPSDGSFIAAPSKDPQLGIYYLTTVDTSKDLQKPKIVFGDLNEALLALNQKIISLRQKIDVDLKGKVIETTVGRLIFNNVLPKFFDYVNKNVAKSANDLDTISLADLFDKALKNEERDTVVKLIDDIKFLGFYYATISGLSVSIFDFKSSPEREAIISWADTKASEMDSNFNMGLITRQEQKSLSQSLWAETTEKVDNASWNMMGDDDILKFMIKSGGAGKASRAQVKQIVGMRGLIADPTGKIVDLPIRGNYKEGLSEFEYFSGSRGSRKGVTDTALRTADAGYLTRRLVDVAQDAIIREDDCGAKKGRVILKKDLLPLSGLKDKISGRFLAEDIKIKGKIVVKRDEMVTEEKAAKIENANPKRVVIRSPLTCIANYGICKKCYGADMNTLKEVGMGVPVGIVAAQSIGEPGTQLTMRTFHTGGIAGKDITQGLPRVEEIFEARAPKSLSIMSEITGKVEILEEKGKRQILVKSTDKDLDIDIVKYNVDPVSEIIVKNGDLVAAGEHLTSGNLNLSELLKVVGIMETQNYIVKEIQLVYSSQGVKLNDKHIEIIVRQMFNKVEVEKSGDTGFLPHEVVTKVRFRKENARVAAEGGEVAEGHHILLGITRSSLETDSFLSAASFMNTSRILTDAASVGAIDRLVGLKENVIVGRLIPTGERARTK